MTELTEEKSATLWLSNHTDILDDNGSHLVNYWSLHHISGSFLLCSCILINVRGVLCRSLTTLENWEGKLRGVENAQRAHGRIFRTEREGCCGWVLADVVSAQKRLTEVFRISHIYYRLCGRPSRCLPSQETKKQAETAAVVFLLQSLRVEVTAAVILMLYMFLSTWRS